MIRVIYFLVFINYSTLAIDPLVLTPRGLIRGLTAEDGPYSMFLGIPYAKVDEMSPFGTSIPHPDFKDAFEAYDDTAKCPQLTGGDAVGTIDCLKLNIFVPDSADSTKYLPVMVFIHGGAFHQGDKKKVIYGPKLLIKHDVILVTINYRLGPYGFLCVSASEYNNQAIRDQITALEWVKENIKAFGGDVSRITVFGQSAGAMSIDLMLLNTEDRLFSRAIVQSGPALSPWVVTPKNDGLPQRIAEHFGFSGDNVTDAIDFLSNLDPINVIAGANQLNLIENNGHPLFKPCIDGNEILPDYPVNIHPKVEGLDIMIGHVNNEIMFMYPDFDGGFYKNYEFGDELAKGFEEILDESIVRDFYIGDKVSDKDVQEGIMNFGSDIAFNYPTDRTVQRYLLGGANRVYRYLFAYDGGRNILKRMMNLTSEGASHGDDLGYLFDAERYLEQPTNEDQAMIDIMTEMWTNFAKYGDPTPMNTDLIPVKWEPTTTGTQYYMLFDLPLAVRNRPFSDRMAFWDLYYQLHSNLEKGRVN